MLGPFATASRRYIASHPYGGDKCRWGGLKLVTFDENGPLCHALSLSLLLSWTSHAAAL